MATEKWLVPNLFTATDVAPVGTITTRYNAAASAASFDGDGGTAWATFLDEFDPDVVEFYIGTARANTDSILTRAIPMLAARGIRLSVTTAGPKGYAPGVTPAPTVKDGTNGSSSATWDVANVLAVIEALGGTVDYIFMDSATRRTISNGSNKSAHAAFRALGTVAANTGIRYTAFLAGAVGNSFRVRYVTSGNNTALSVSATTDMTTHLLDTFTRTEATTWGSGWTTVTAASVAYAVDGSKASITLSAAAKEGRAYSPVVGADQIATATFSLPVLPVGATHVVGVWLRYADSSNQYRCNVNIEPSGSATASILKSVAGTVSSIAAGVNLVATDDPNTTTDETGEVLTIAAGSRYIISAQAVGTAIAMRVWQEGRDRPASAIRSATDSSLASGTNVALTFSALTGTTGLPVVATFDDVHLTNTPTTGDVTVNLATNGSGVAISTATEVRDAVEAHTTASSIVTAAHSTGSSGAGVPTAVGYTALLYGDDGYNFTQAEVATEIVSYMQTMLAARPNVRFIWHDAFVLAPYDGIAGYSGADYPGGQQPDAKTTITTVMTALQTAGILGKLHAVHNDMAYEFAEGDIVSANMAARSDWYAWMHTLDTQVVSWGVGTQASFTSAYGATPGYPGASDAGVTASDAENATRVLAFVKAVLASKPVTSPMLSGCRAQSFQYHPRTLAPYTAADSFLDLARRIWGAYGLVTGSGTAPRVAAAAPAPRASASAPVPRTTASAPVPKAAAVR